jgi:NAD(P)-dependent dehydrogenase (short-subunit alcohol dehydrogenase family)
MITGRAILVTGAARGVGRAVALAFAERGDRVAVHHRASPADAAAVVAALPGTGHVAVQADLADPEAVRTMVQGAATAFGGSIDVLVNNAAAIIRHPILQSSYDEWQQAWRESLEVNLIGAANATWCVVRQMPAGGRVVNVSSRGAFRGEPEHPAYGASKAGLNSFGQSMALALAPQGISVTGVAPGFIEPDPSNADRKLPRGEDIQQQSPFGRIVTAGEVAAAVLYLASPAAEFASGTIIDLNGASYLRT